MHYTIRIGLIGCIALAGAALVPLDFAPGKQSASAARDPEVLWDRWGVPHIFASDLEGAMHAFGWAQMEAHGDLILRLYGQARGRGAEYWGASYTETDRWVRTMGVPARAAAWVKAQDASMRAPLAAFVAGVNGYARAHADKLSRDVQVVLPVSVDDVMAHILRVVHFAFVANPQSLDAQMKGRPTVPTRDRTRGRLRHRDRRRDTRCCS